MSVSLAAIASTVLVTSSAFASFTAAQYPTVRSGSTGGFVEVVQANMWSSGYMSTVGNIDGIYGTKTITAVKDYQNRQGITADGITGPATWKQMDRYITYTYPGSGHWYYTHPGTTTYQTNIFNYSDGDTGTITNWTLTYKSGNGYIVDSGSFNH